MLELKDIKKSYKTGEISQQVLKGINIKFRRNEFASILGTSGSRKTTLLNINGGLDKYSSGDLVIEGVSTKKYSNRDWDSYRNYRVGFIFQSYNLIMHQTILSNVEIALTLSGVPKSERKRRAIDVLTKVGLKEHINKKPNQLSGGQMQRVAIARALVNDPEIILADEPTGALDSKTSVQIMDLLKEIAKDKLVIMVTHNPELAKEYSTRIIELKDGVIINDSNPYKEDKEDKKELKTGRTSMSLLTSLSLSFNNLMTKKGRTFLTAFAGSIGIIGIALILALSNGVQKYASKIEKESLTDYPIKIEKTSYDVFGGISAGITEKQNTCKGDKLCSNDDIVKESVVSSSKGLVVKNNLKEFKKYIENNDQFQKNATDVYYGYDFELQVYRDDYAKVNPTNLKAEGNLFDEISSKKDAYKVLIGTLPSNYDEVVLVVGSNKQVDDSILYALGIKNNDELLENLDKIKKDEKYRVQSSDINYSEFINRTYKLILNTDYYKEENGSFIDYTNDLEYMKSVIDNGMDIKIVGVVLDKDTSNAKLGYTHDLTMNILKQVSETSIYKKQMENIDVNVLTGTQFDGISNTYEELSKKLAIYDIEEPSSISIYPNDYESKEKIVKLIDKYNKEKKSNHQEELVITYNDIMKTLVGGIRNIIKIVSFVLIGFVAISLVVSSIMIGIITYISVLERTKEIGILRAIGASKKDIRRVFRAETIIEGLVAGLIGILIALIISLQINLIVGKLAKINGIASLPIGSAIFLILLSIILNVIAGSKPSRMAAKKDPVEALRSE